jgi:hypothetical protein
MDPRVAESLLQHLRRDLEESEARYRELAQRTNHYRQGWMMQAPFIEYHETGARRRGAIDLRRGLSDPSAEAEFRWPAPVSRDHRAVSEASSSEGRRRSSLVGRVRERSVSATSSTRQLAAGVRGAHGVPGGQVRCCDGCVTTFEPTGCSPPRPQVPEMSLQLRGVARLCTDLPEVRQLVRSAATTTEPPPMTSPVAVAFADAIVARARRRLVVVLLDDADELEPASKPS